VPLIFDGLANFRTLGGIISRGTACRAPTGVARDVGSDPYRVRTDLNGSRPHRDQDDRLRHLYILPAYGLEHMEHRWS